MNTENSVEEIIYQLEEELMQFSAGKPVDRLQELLADGFQEVGSSGAVYDREQTIRALTGSQSRTSHINNFKLIPVHNQVVLARYQAVINGAVSERCSVWVRKPEGWKIQYHQGTRAE